ncbi:two-component system sensor histidine kinase PilS (NtrC family) [Psychrobacter sp. PL15]|uniref:sensor histidine kinase n=1 Tax=Psychrobacter sp. PL15 TaxID=3071719 RepID=UPI002DF947FD|nr:two-component system sensor histidine kinase PilS (NtrC family) [Psychrobacter sp. PL15]
MKVAVKTITALTTYLQQVNTLPASQLRRIGLIYSSYRLIISIFFMLMVYITTKTDGSLLLPSLLQQTVLSFYVLLSLIMLGLFYVATKQLRRQLAFGLALDVIILSLLLYTKGAPDLQLTMLYMVVVAASFMMLHSSQALVITLLAIIFVIYQQFFYAIANSMSLSNLGDALLMSASFLAVGFLSWSISQRLVHAERVAAHHAKEVARLHDLNQEVISQMVNGVIVIDRQWIILANLATYQLLSIPKHLLLSLPDAASEILTKTVADSDIYPTVQDKSAQNQNDDQQTDTDSSLLSAFQQQLAEQHPQLLDGCLSVAIGQSRTFTYELPAAASASVVGKLRVQIIPLKDCSQLVILEDLRREQASAQQLKLASLGQLTASIAHEIRNPLAAISQASQLLMEEVVERVTDNNIASDTTSGNINAAARDAHADSNHTSELTGNHELYKMIFAQTKRVNHIIENVLKLSRQQIPKQQTLVLAEWIPLFLDNYFRDHDVFLRMHTQPIILFDTHQLEQILINLINNGLRHSSYAHPHAYVEIEIYCAENDVIVDVLDNGTGVSTTNLLHLFNPFFTTGKSGTGLGLYLSQSFCEANQARLLYVPEHEKTCFRLVAPAADTAAMND